MVILFCTFIFLFHRTVDSSFSSILNSKTSISDESQDLIHLKNIFLRNSMIVLKEKEFKSLTKPNLLADEMLVNVESDEFSFVGENNILVQGDIIEPIRPKREKRRIINDSLYGNPTRWPNNTIPFEFDYDANDALRKKVYTAISLWHEHTCIRFEPYSPTQHPNHKCKVLIRNRGHCAARVGYVVDPFEKVTVSDVFLPEHCPLGSVIHELGHVIGFRHEHTRSDRTQHIKVHFERMQSSQRSQYEIMDNGHPGYFGIYYDLFSIMHYSSQGGLLEARDHRRSFLMGQRFTLSFSDIKMANKAYSCDEKCPNKMIECLNEGFIDATCRCKCSDGISGDFCEIINEKETIIKTVKNPSLTCDFEQDLCDWIQEDLRDTDDFVRQTGSFNALKLVNNSFNIDSNNSFDSTYVFLKSIETNKQHANAILITPQISVDKKEKHCIEFDYFINNQSIFSNKNINNNKSDSKPVESIISLKLRNLYGSLTELWNSRNGINSNWNNARIEFEVKPPDFLLVLEASTSNWKLNHIAIDNIKYTTSACNFTLSEWSEWSSWSNCSKECGTGNKTRSRQCVGTNCKGESIEFNQCNKHDCFSKNDWSSWSDWSNCSVECGSGIQLRKRACLKTKCKGYDSDIKPCFNEICKDTIWSEWSDWSKCKTVCDENQTNLAFKFRTRECLVTNSSKTYSPIKCLGLSRETKLCEINSNDCETANYKWSEWSVWSACSATCESNQGVQTRNRKCLSNKKKSKCLGISDEKRACKSEIKCKIGASEWSEWSKCSTNCGSNGFKSRIRKCSKKYNDYPCETGLELVMERIACSSYENCSNNQTVVNKTNKNKKSSDLWSEWSTCSENCLSGLKTRTFNCSINEKNCIVDQITCRNTQCLSQEENVTMKCTFDSKETCLIENIIDKEQIINWMLGNVNTIKHLSLSNSPISGGNFIYVNNAKASKSKFKTFTIGIKQGETKCLSFYYNLGKFSSLEVFKIEFGGFRAKILDINLKHQIETKEWKRVIILLESTYDYHLEFSASFTQNDPNSYVLVDDILISQSEYCQELHCTFDNENDCKQSLIGNELNWNNLWIREKYDFFHRIYSLNYNYLKLNMSKLSTSNENALYALPKIFPLYSQMCLSFIYFLNGSTSSLDLKLYLIEQNSTNLNLIWHETSQYNALWKRAYVDLDSNDLFQIAIQVVNVKKQKLLESENLIAVDNFKLTYGYCNLKNRFNQNDLIIPDKITTKNRTKRFYNDFFNSNKEESCGGVYELRFGQSLVLQSQGYPLAYALNQRCVYLIRVPSNLKIHFKLLDLSIEDNSEHNSCNDYLEIRYFNLGQPGPKFCGDLMKYNNAVTMTSFKNDALIIFNSDWAVTKRGFKLQINTCY